MRQACVFPNWSKAALAVGLLLAAVGVYTLAFDDEARQHKLEAEGGEDVISAACGRELHEWDDISGIALRQLLLGASLVGIATVRLEVEAVDTDASTSEEE